MSAINVADSRSMVVAAVTANVDALHDVRAYRRVFCERRKPCLSTAIIVSFRALSFQKT
jgi:hypothetical protein